MKEDLEKLLTKVSDITLVDYLNSTQCDEDKLFVALEDLLSSYKHLKEEKRELEEDLLENYKPKKIEI